MPKSGTIRAGGLIVLGFALGVVGGVISEAEDSPGVAALGLLLMFGLLGLAARIASRQAVVIMGLTLGSLAMVAAVIAGVAGVPMLGLLLMLAAAAMSVPTIPWAPH